MGELILAAPVAGLASRSRILASDVLMLRREVFRDGVATRSEAESLFALDSAATNKCDEWTPFFVEAVSDYVVFAEPPSGYVSPENAAWLRRAITRDGRVDTVTEFELLVTVLEKATSVPADLSAFALAQVSDAVIDNKGPLGGSHTDRVIDAGDVRLIRRILYAAGGEGNVAISHAEAEVLIALNEATDPTSNDPAFNDLFVKGIGSFLLAATGYTAPPRETALAQEEFLADGNVDLGGFFSRMLAGGLKALSGAMGGSSMDDHWRQRNERQAEASRISERLDREEVEWLARRLGRTGRVNDNERALLRFLSENAAEIHPDMNALLQRAV